MSDDKLYDAAAELWKYFASWREKLFAGYLTVVGALAFAFLQQSSPGRQSIALLTVILMSVVFWLHDVRVRELFSAMQGVAAEFESKSGGYRALDSIRFDGTSPITHGLAINVLVVSIIAASVGGLAVLLPRWYNASRNTPAVIFIAAAVAVCLLFLLVHRVGRIERDAEQQLRKHLSGAVTKDYNREESADGTRPRPTLS
jgi:hypothetical protein